MEARIRPDHNGLGKKSLEWDLNDWKWDGDLFVASPLNAAPLDCRNKQLFPGASNGGRSNSSSTCSEETDFGVPGKGKRESEKRRRVVVVEDDQPYDGAGALTLKLGSDLENWEEKNGKRSKVQGGNSNRMTCQVEGCGADLSNAKAYHRRHKVCGMHARASTALVNNVMQRFCQQCSRFHLLQEFDEGKRSCRRRLAGHNRRRRKTHPEPNASGNPLVDDQASSYLLISLLRVLSNLHRGSSDQSKDQDLLSHLLRNLGSPAGSFDVQNLSGLLQASQFAQKLPAGTSSEVDNGVLQNRVPAQESTKPSAATAKMTCTTGPQGHLRPTDLSESTSVAAVHVPLKRNMTEASLASTEERVRLKDFDLNNEYSETQNCREGSEKPAAPPYFGTGSPICQQSSPHQMSINSESSSASLSSSNGDAQSRTDRIVFKLFGKNPSDFPLVLRAQILDWLSHSPTDMESYIRPGCIILTIYLRLPNSAWEELCSELSFSLNRLLSNSTDGFWRTGWVYTRIQHRVAFIYNGQLVLNTPVLRECSDHCKILCVKPVASTPSARVNFIVKGFNLARPTTRLLCAFEGNYLVQEKTGALVEGTDTGREQERSQRLSFSCILPNTIGRGFIEVEDHGLGSCFFPFIVAEEDVCSEIRTLEKALDIVLYDDKLQERAEATILRNQALEFLNEMGWLLRKSHLKSRSNQVNSCLDVFSLTRFRWLLSFAMDREWCAVVRKLLDLLFRGTIDIDGHSPRELALSEGLLHNAVRKNCKSMVELLLKYTPDSTMAETGCEKFLFRPDAAGPSSITPLHISATMSGCEGVLDALTDDPGLFGIKAWKSARDITGFTPDDYARSVGHESYIHLVQKKIDRQLNKGHVVLNILGNLSAVDATHKQSDGSKSAKLTSFDIDKSKLRQAQRPYCNLCSRQQQLALCAPRARTLIYRPAMLSLLGIAAVCVCVALLFKGPPEVLFVFPAFRWEDLEYGWI